MNRDLLDFSEIIWDYYNHNGRDLPWRVPEPDGSFDPYKIMVSEIMLQQTQVVRVIEKYNQFLKKFPNIETLAESSFSEVLSVWSGLGYNRRAKYLLESSKIIHQNGEFYDNPDKFAELPGIGPNTAAAICVYAYNMPHVFIETNVRTVFIYHFFRDRQNVEDAEISPLVKETLDREHAREWYWALMDYGTHIKSVYGNTNRQSKHYTKQSVFKGSRRQLRAQVLKSLLKGRLSKDELQEIHNDKRMSGVLYDLVKEGLIRYKNNYFELT